MYVVQYTQRNLKINRDIKIKVFWHFPRTANVKSHVTSALPLGLRFEVYVCTAKPRCFDY